MKMALSEFHGFNSEAVKQMEREFLGKEMSGEEILKIMAKQWDPLVPARVEDGVVYVAHVGNW